MDPRGGKELTLRRRYIWELFQRTYLLSGAPLTLVKQVMLPTSPDSREMVATLRKADGATLTLDGAGNGPIDAFVDALKRGFALEFSFLDYHEHCGRAGAGQRVRGVLTSKSRSLVFGQLHAARGGDRSQHRDGLAEGDVERGNAADGAGRGREGGARSGRRGGRLGLLRAGRLMRQFAPASERIRRIA